MNELLKLEHANRMLAEVKDAYSAKTLMAKASAVKHYAQKKKLGATAINYAHAVKIDAEVLLGQYLKIEPKAMGSRGQLAGRNSSGGTHKEPPEQTATPTLADLGLTKKESVEAQLLADLAKRVPAKLEALRSNTTTVTKVRRELHKAAVTAAAKLPSDKYRVIYADPPWKYGDQLTEDYGPTRFHYPAMSIPELCTLPVSDLTEANAVLFLWVTSPLLEAAFPVIKAWGFAYKTSFVWDKVKHNMGHYNSVRHEFLLVATRGSCTPDVAKLYDSVVTIERTIHSAKPPEFRRMIDALYPHGKRLELFAREKVDGWQMWGNQNAATQTISVRHPA